jgi:hypothetical protein
MLRFQQLFFYDFMPHAFCCLWDPRIVWLQVISDGGSFRAPTDT